MSDSLSSYGLQRARLPCPSLLVCGVHSTVTTFDVLKDLPYFGTIQVDYHN